MSDLVQVQLSPAHVPMLPGQSQVEVVVSVHNTSDAPSEYAIEVIGLEAGWFTPPPTGLRLYEDDRGEIRFKLHPPRRAARGTYAYRVVVQSATSSARESGEGKLEVLGNPQYEPRMSPRRQAGRGEATFQVQLANTGGQDLTITLDAHDTGGACQLRFGRDPTVKVVAGQTARVPLRVRADKRPWIGSKRSYDFTVTARPDEGSLAPQTLTGQFMHRPWLTSWAPIRNTVFVLVGLAVALNMAAVVPVGVAGPIGGLKNLVCSVPMPGCPNPNPTPKCLYSEGFQAYAQAAAQLIGACVTEPLADPFGNVRQYTKNGVLFWQHDSNTVYFFKGDSLYGFIDEKSVLIRGSGAS